MRLAIDGLALRQVVVVLAGEQRIAIAADNALDVAVENIRIPCNQAHLGLRTRI